MAHLIFRDQDEALAFTDEAERQEVADLSIRDVVKLESDLRGITSGVDRLRLLRSDQGEAASLLRRLDEAIGNIPVENKAAYLQAQVHCPSIVNDPEVREVFLHREDCDPTKAASRLVEYWEVRLQTFGAERAFLPMTLDGAMRGQEFVLRKGLVALLPVRDDAGRAIVMLQPGRRDFDVISPEQEAMAKFYIMEAALEDPEVRKRGVVVVVNGKGVEKRHYNLYLMRLLTSVCNCVPFQLRALHLCHPSAVGYYVLFPVLKTFVGKHIRRRFKIHRGTDEQILVILDSFRLPRSCVPTDLGGDLCVDTEAFIADRRATERGIVAAESVDINGGVTPASAPTIAGTSSTEPAAAIMQTPEIVNVPAATNAKRVRTDNNSSPDSIGTANTANTATSGTSATSASSASTGTSMSRSTTGKRMTYADARMKKAVELRLANPNMKLLDALEQGGFVFGVKDAAGEEVDAGDGVRLSQRKNQLSRRLRLAKKAQEAKGNAARDTRR